MALEALSEEQCAAVLDVAAAAEQSGFEMPQAKTVERIAELEHAT